jgi:Tfp pilus assembly protein PilP
MNSKIVQIIQIIFLLILLGLSGCPKKKPKPVSGKPIEEKGIVTVKKIEEEREIRYRYAGEKGRDPFAPPEQRSEGIGWVGKRGIEIDLSRLKLTGIMISPSSRDHCALIDVGGGRGYVVKGGKLIDNYNRVVQGVAAIVRKDKVILITSDNVIRELRLKAEE